MTIEQALGIEQKHNVYVDSETMQYNQDGHDAVYGWRPIPKEWINEVK